MKTYIVSAFLIFLANSFFLYQKSQAQINAYAQVTSITGADKVLNLGTVDETNHTFEDGDDIILMQMQASCIGSNTSNNVNFGNISNISAVGRFLVCRIVSHTETSGVPTSITVQSTINIAFVFGATESVQIVSFRKYGSPNFTTTANMIAKNWDGVTGGIIAFQVAGTLTLAHSISASGAGFRGGNVSTNFYPGGSTCDATQYMVTSNYTNNGQKGEGIYRTTNNNFLYARGKLLNGGGGGNSLINGGGGGGGNYTQGGEGGAGWNNTVGGCSPGVGGVGGIALSTYISGSRIFMGGGGGGGQQNDSQGTNGGNGGGIVFIKANQIITTGTCGITISANGNTVTGLTNDGQGGGGAGGSIMIQTNSWSVVNTCPITVSANGGNGGSVNSSTHGGGGGGGQGVIIYSVAIPTTNTTNQTNNGTGGCNDGGCTSAASTGSGTNGTGIVGNVQNNLPITLASFDLFAQNQNFKTSVLVKWNVLSQENCKSFEIEKTQLVPNDDFSQAKWETIAQIDGAGTTNNPKSYQITDDMPFVGTSYYRIKQIDVDNKVYYFPIKDIFVQNIQNLIIYPNPTTEKVFVKLEINNNTQINSTKIEVFDQMGRKNNCEITQNNDQNNTLIEINLANLPSGIYLIKIVENGNITTKKVIKN